MNSFTFPFTFDGNTYNAFCRPESGEEGKIHYYVDLPGTELPAKYGSPIRITRTREGLESYPDTTPTGLDDGRRLIASVYGGFSAYRKIHPGLV